MGAAQREVKSRCITRRRRTAASGYRGQGYIESGQIHLSSGLILPFAAEMTRKNDRGYYDPSWLLAFDVICLDLEGR
jgi:hypothetical protein